MTVPGFTLNERSDVLVSDSMQAPAWVHVALGTRAYNVCIGRSVLTSIGNAIESLAPKARAVAFIVDDNVPALHVDAAVAEVSLRCRACTLAIHASENDKSLETLDRCVKFLTANRIERSDIVVALGGGIVGDIAGFAAASYRRGVPFIQCPTTLLSMVDASVGGKTGVNLRSESGTLLKNMVGAFHQPLAVLADLALLDSLPKREFRAGLAEMIKHAVLAPPAGRLWEETVAFVGSSPSSLSPNLAELIRRNVEYKAGLVVLDEREELPSSAGGRALLNLGHTFGHAIETIPHLSPTDQAIDAPLSHGESVALGMVAAARAAVMMGLLNGNDAAKLIAVIELSGLPTRVANLPPAADVLDRMLDDKKVTGGDLRLVLPHAFGDVRVVENLNRSAILSAIRTLAAENPG